MKYDEDTLVQETTAEYLRDQLGWESVYAYNTERFGKEGTLGRKDETEVILTRYLGEALVKLNPGLPQEAYQAAIREITQADRLAVAAACQSREIQPRARRRARAVPG